MRGKRNGARLQSSALLLLLLLTENCRVALSRTIATDDYLAAEGDMTSVGSLRREVRQPVPAADRVATEVADLIGANNAPVNKKHLNNASGKSNEGGFYKTFGSDADGEKGYLKKSFSKGEHGYKSHDTFHKKLGDRYGFEEHEAFGKATAKDQQKKAAAQKTKQQHDHEGAGTDVETHYAGDDYGYGDGGEYYSGGEGGGEGGGDTSSYSEGDSDGYSESYSSDSGDGGDEGSASHEAYSADGESSSEEGDGSYY